MLRIVLCRVGGAVELGARSRVTVAVVAAAQGGGGGGGVALCATSCVAPTMTRSPTGTT